MTRVSYQAILAAPRVAPADRFVPLPDGSIATGRKRATATLQARISPEQERWLAEVVEVGGGEIDADAVVRAALDLLAELDLDWPLLTKPRALRTAVRHAVHVRRSDGV